MKEFDSILDFIKKVSKFDIFLVSLVLLPFVLQAWVTIFVGLGRSKDEILILLFTVIALYIFGIFIMYRGVSQRRNRELAKNQIIAYLQGKGFIMVSFDRVREKINKTYTDSFLNSVIADFPEDLRKAKLKGNKAGVARLTEESDQSQDG